MSLEITDQNYEALVLNSPQPVVIDFWAQWCSPCKVVSAAIDSLAEDYTNQVVIGKVDVDSNPALTAKYGVRNMPTVLFLKDGEVVDKHVGATFKAVLEDKLKQVL